MPRAALLQPSFNKGEWSPLTYGRADKEDRGKAMSLCRDFIPLVQGPVSRRPGTWYVAAAKQATDVRLQRFAFNVTQAYILEFGNLYVRFYTNQGQLLSGGAAYEVATPYTTADLWGLEFTQSADVLYIVHPSYAPRKLSRLGATNWTLTTIAFQDGPYLAQNISDTYVSCTVSRVGSSGTITATSTAGINGGAGFQASDVGRLIRIRDTAWSQGSTTDPTKWVWAKITAVTDTTHASVTIQGIVAQ